MGKKLVAYFSAGGITKKVAETLAQAACADLHEIRPAVPYTQEDLDWRNSHSRSSVEMQDKSSRPEMAGTDFAIGAYDVIFLGFPIWWYVAPTIINTFLESHDFTGKRIILFATSGGSGFGRTLEGLRKSLPEGVDMSEGKILNGNPPAAELEGWLRSLGLSGCKE